MKWITDLIAKLFGLWQAEKKAQVMDQGINYQKAKESGDALNDAKDAQVIGADVDRMSDDRLRNSPYANKRD